jgi:hypothetical protein
MKKTFKGYKKIIHEVFGEFLNWTNLILLILLVSSSYISPLYKDQIWILVLSLAGSVSGIWLLVRIIIESKISIENLIKNDKYEKERRSKKYG